MIVVDASAMVEALVGSDVAEELLEGMTGVVHAPHLLDVEVLSVLRGLTLGGKLDLVTAEDLGSADESRAEGAKCVFG